MRAITKHALGQLSHLGLLSLAIESGAAGNAQLESRLALQSREQLIDALTRTGPLKRLTERADSRLQP